MAKAIPTAPTLLTSLWGCFRVPSPAAIEPAISILISAFGVERKSGQSAKNDVLDPFRKSSG